MGLKALVLPSDFAYNVSMKVWVCKTVTILLSALVLTASADVAFALPKKLPKLKNVKVKTLATRKIPTARPNVAIEVERATANAAKQTAKQAAAAKAVKPVKAPKVATPTVTPKITPVQDTGTNLTGTQVLAHYYPTWRQELGGKFSPEQLDAVEKAFADTDEWMFVRGEDGELTVRNKDEWNYEERFLTILKDSGVKLTDKQIKRLIGTTGIQGFTLKAYFFRMNAAGFTCAKGTKPRDNIYRNGQRLTSNEITSEEIQETKIGKGLSKNANHPAIIAYMKQNRLLAENKTAEEYVALARQYPTKPRATIFRNGHILTREEMTPEEIQKVKIGAGLSYYRNHPAVIAYMKENRLKAENKTAEEYVASACQYPTKPRSGITRNGRKLKREEMTPEEIQEVIIGIGLYSYRNHPAVIAYMKENRLRAENQTAEQLYTVLTTHIKDYGHYPMQKENSLQNIIYQRLRKHQSTMTDGKYADPWLQKIYEIKQWSERVKKGEVDWEQFPELFLKHRKTIGQMREQGILPSKESAKELEQLPAEEQEAIEQMADNMLTLWEDFEGVWWKQNYKHVITTPQTQTAFNTVLKTVQTQVPGAANVNISNVLEQVNGMQLGQDGPDYYRVIYRGDNPRIPRAEDFHNVLETQGIPQANAQAAYKLNSPHIVLDGDEETVYNLIIRQGVTDRVTDKEMSAVIDALTPAGWEIRLGAHELLNEIKQGFIHIHIEQVVPTTEEDAQDISNVLRVDLRALTQGKNPQQVAKTLRYLFSKYLKDDGHQALNNIQKAF